jgi:2-oxoglutarate ferredoxin oxidoreductase subunit gamma
LKKTEVRICGLGGQGVVIAGQILGRAAIYSGKNAVQTQSYGAEARGSGAKSEVIISDGKIGFPVIRKCDILVAMSQEAVGKNVKDLKEDGVLLVDSSLVKEVPEVKAKIVGIPATETAEKSFGERLYTNMIMLGALTKAARLVTQEAMEEAIRESVPEKAADANVEAYKKGMELAASLD